MNQEDFRKLLATPRPASSSSSTSTTSEFKKPDAISGNNTTNKSKKQQQIRNRKKQQGEGDAVGEEAEITEVGSSLYRDRAAERRKGINNDYAESENIIKTLTNSNTPSVLHLNNSGSSSISYEQSKFLGGDLEHTHLVKGLDFTLLKKVKSDLHIKDIVEDPLQIDASEREAMKYVESLSSSFNHDEGGGGVPQFRSRFAERVWRVAMDQVEPLTSQQQQSDMFVPGRSLYKWDLGFEVETGAYIGSYDLPLTITRSRAETKTFDHEQRGATDSSLAETSALVLEKVSRIFETHRMVAKSQGAKSAASRKAAAAKVAMPPPPSLPPPPKLKSSIPATISTASGDSDDDDIFGDAGTDYIVARSSSSISSSSNPYFNNKEMDLDAMGEKKPGPPINDVSSLLKDTVGMLDSLQGAGSASKIIEKKQEVVVESATSIDSDVVPQRLERLQPMQDPLNDFQGLGQQGDDSGGEDEEADFEQIDVGVKARKKRQLTRADFQDDDSFHEYKNNQVALPKAAFRFGIKGSDKKATGFNRTKNKEKGKRKLEREFEQLDNVMAKKYGRSLKE